MKYRGKKKIDPAGRGGQPVTACAILEMLFADTKLGAAFREWEVVAGWAQIAGGIFAKVTECDRVEKGRLYVKVKSAGWRQELAYQKDVLMDAIARETDCRTIKEIVFY